MRVEPDQLSQLLRPVFDEKAKKSCFSQKKRSLQKALMQAPALLQVRLYSMQKMQKHGQRKAIKLFLVRRETSPEDIGGMNAAEGILTALGGMTSHAALVARQMGKVCVAGCGALLLDYKKTYNEGRRP